ncbi:MAG: ABC transporter substrate-binding protein [Proteobacteria bacterium]|nr:ABC transporter substrate-binding protein [Pseudomonadota bacterium]
MRSKLLLGAMALLVSASSAGAQALKIGLAAEPTSMDPHFHYFLPNNAVTSHVFDMLVDADSTATLRPRLALSWRAIDDKTWEFKLRPGVKFSDGSNFTANDVIYSICRVPTIENSPGSFAGNTRPIAGMKASDPLTLRIATDQPYPLLPNGLYTIAILSATANGAGDAIEFDRAGCRGVGTFPKSEDFNSGKAMIGTGPFKLVQYARGERIVLERNEGYWGEKPIWQAVTFLPLSKGASRVAALLTGDADLIEQPPLQDLERIKKSPALKLISGPPSRPIYLHFDHSGEPSPGVSGIGGKNPLKDRRVREAISKAIDREAIVARVMEGFAAPAAEMLPPALFGANKDANPDKYDPATAKRLLAEAGYANGFSLVLGTPNDRYTNDAQVAQAVAQMLSRVGIATSVEALPGSRFFAKRNKGEFSFWLAGWLSDTGEMSSALKPVLVTPNKDKGTGTVNSGGYSNPKLDTLFEQAIATIDDTARAALLAAASREATTDYGVIPLHFEMTLWALRKDLTYRAPLDQRTIATFVGRAAP